MPQAAPALPADRADDEGLHAPDTGISTISGIGSVETSICLKHSQQPFRAQCKRRSKAA
jgi:hypothetical protein